jgi:osmotically inducible lipoprotein OsmB
LACGALPHQLDQLNNKRFFMRFAMKAGLIAFMLAATPVVAQAGTLEGAAIGAGTGAVVAGPPGAVVGGVIGAAVGGPDLRRPRAQRCWRDRYGDRVCSSR